MIAALVATLVLGGQAQNSAIAQKLLPSPIGGAPRTMLQYTQDRLPRPQLSPKRFGDPPIPWEFDWVVGGFAQVRPDDPRYLARFRVFSQERKRENDPAVNATQTLLRLYEHNLFRLGIDHNGVYNDGIVDVYLCWGGKAGGEQLFDDEIRGNRPVKVNTIYIYDLASFTDPIEMLREVAHEYGHASLPAVGGFTEPEDWANGYLGEKLFMAHLADGLEQGIYGPNDVFGVPKDALRGWVTKNVDPLILRSATSGPEPSLLSGKNRAAMDAYLGLSLYAAAILPNQVFARSLRLVGSTHAKDVPQAIELAVEEPESVRLTIPPMLRGKAIWIPIGKGSVSGAQILTRKGSWARIQPGNGPVTIVSKRPKLD